MRAILIDPKAQEVFEAEITSDYQDIYHQIEADIFQAVVVPDLDAVIWVDEEGLLRPIIQPHWWIDGYNGVLTGRGLLTGFDDTGDTAETLLSLDKVREKIRWLPEVKFVTFQSFYTNISGGPVIGSRSVFMNLPADIEEKIQG
jgi:hypothetical protein